MARKVSEFKPKKSGDFDAGAISSTFEGDADSNPGDDLDCPDDDFLA